MMLLDIVRRYLTWIDISLDQVMPSILYFMQCVAEDVDSIMHLFLSNYLSRMKATSPLNGKQMVHIGQILEVILLCIVFLFSVVSFAVLLLF